MIGKIWGRVDEIEGDQLLLEVAGIGYIISVSHFTLRQLTQDQKVCLRIESSKKDEQTIFFGFVDKLEQMMFRYLISIQGVGGKMAMAILGEFAPLEIVDIITEQEAKKLQKTSGVGPKLANRIVSELKANKNLYRDIMVLRSEVFTVRRTEQGLGSAELQGRESAPEFAGTSELAKINNSVLKDSGNLGRSLGEDYVILRRDAMSALTNLGFSKPQAAQAIEEALLENLKAEETSESQQGEGIKEKPNIGLDGLIREALRLLT